MLGMNICTESRQMGPSWVFDFSHKGFLWTELLLTQESSDLLERYAFNYAVGIMPFRYIFQVASWWYAGPLWTKLHT